MMPGMTGLARFRTILGFLIAPVSPGLLAVVVAAPFYGPAVFSLKFSSDALLIVGLSAVFGYPVGVIGIPVYALLRWRGWNGWLVHAAAGAALGPILYLIHVVQADLATDGLWSLTGRAANTVPVYIPLGMICGAVAGSFYWLIARPDRG
jgi:hypothetical protein